MNSKVIDFVETDRLLVRSVGDSEVAALRSICSSWDTKKLMTGGETFQGYMLDCLIKGETAIGGSHDSYQIMAIYSKEMKKVIGYLDLYYGYPLPSTIWISVVMVQKEYRRKGYATEAMRGFVEEAAAKAWSKMGIGVHLKDWVNLKFWTEFGFDCVLGIYGDPQCVPNAHAVMALEMKLN